MIEIRWHARAGQGAKTASQLLALALLRAGKQRPGVPGVRPRARAARRCARTPASTTGPIRRHDAIDGARRRRRPRAVARCARSTSPTGCAADGLLLVNARARRRARRARVACVAGRRDSPSPRLASNVVMLGALAAALGEPPLEDARRTPRSSCSARKARARRACASRRVAGGISMGGADALATELAAGGASCPARRRAAAHRRLAHRPQARGRPRPCVNCLLCWLYCPDSAVRLDGRRVQRLRPRLLQGLRDLRRGLPGRRDRDGAADGDVTLAPRAAADRRRGRRRGDAPDRPRRRARLPDHAADADHPELREARRRRPRARRSSSTSSPSTRR